MTISALVDIKQGGDVHNGTRGALYSYGTHKDTEDRETATKVFQGLGPGAGKEVPLDQGWYLSGLGNNFNGPASQFVENGSYVKLREFCVIQRSGYIRAGGYLVELLKARNDPRLPSFFSRDVSNEYTGLAPGEASTDVSNLSDYFLDPALQSDILTYEETQFIIAECEYMAGNEAAARMAMNSALAALEAKWGADANSLPRYDAATTGQALFEKICEEKYIALFLNIEVYNDWKRTKRPVLVPYGGGDPEISIPHRIYYGADERNANSNIPPPAAQPTRNDNDPN